MATKTKSGKDPILVVLQLLGGNDYLNTVIPYTNGTYHDNRPNVRIPADQVLPLTDLYGFPPSMAALKPFWDRGKMAILNGIGYPQPNYSHFRSMDIWYTCEPLKVGTEGWLGKATRQIDPQGENVLTAVNFGRGLPRAFSLPGVPVASVAQLETYGLLTSLSDAAVRQRALEVFSRVYAPMEGEGEVIRYFGQTGLDAQKGADILRTVPAKYTSSVKYPEGNPVAANLKGVVQVMNANLGTRIFYTSHGSFDTHSNEAPLHAKLWKEVSEGVAAFYDDLKEHHLDEDIILFLWSEFGRRVKDNGSGTDHGAGGVAFVIGESVKGGMYGEFPSLAKEKLTQNPEPGNLLYNVDFRQLHTTIAGKWMGLDDKAICNGTFEYIPFLN